MLAIALLTSGYILLLIGVGLLLPWGLFRSAPGFYHLFSAFWLGLALTIAFLQLWQIFLPVGVASLLLLVAAALGGWLLSWRQLVAWLSSFNRFFVLIFAVFATGLVLVLINQAMLDEPTPDHGLYHMQTVLWFTSYALPPGLVNLHYRLAFNHAGFLLAAQIENGFLPGLAYYATHPLLFAALLLHTAGGLIFALRNPHEIRRTHLAAAFLFLVTLKYAGETHFAGYAPDRMIFILQAVLALAVLDLFEKPYLGEAPFERRAAYAIFLIGLGVALKLSFAAFGLMAVLAVVYAWGRRKGWVIYPNIRPVLYAGALLGVLFIPWMVRGVIMSGYPLFPSSFLSLPVNWRMAPNEAAVMTDIITNWARTCSNTMPVESGKLWLLTWKSCMPPQFWELNFLSVMTFGAVALLAILPKPARTSRPDYAGPLALLSISVVSFLFWLWFAPDYRFAAAIFWLLLLSAALLLAEHSASFLPTGGQQKALVAFALIFLIWLSPNNYNFNVQRRTFLYPPSAAEAAKSPFKPVAEIISHPMPGGGVLYSPSDSYGLCWDAPLPCTQYNDVHPRLTLFDPDNLRAGFYIAPLPAP